MNSKKAKALRRLSENLQDKGLVSNPKWEDVGFIEHQKPVLSVFGDKRDGYIPSSYQRVLDNQCGKALYKRLKKSTLNGRY